MNSNGNSFTSLPRYKKGKVRELFSIPGRDKLILIVASDRVSTDNIVHKSLVPSKGRILNALSIFWLREILTDIPNHIVAYGKGIYDYLPKDCYHSPDIHLRAVVARELHIIPIEFIWRAYMSGSLWREYYSKGIDNPYGIDLPDGLKKMSKFGVPIFTPTEKSKDDDPVTAHEVKQLHGEAVELTYKIFKRGREYANARGGEFVDFKGEVGRDIEGNIYVGDEWLNGDCCRFVELGSIKIGEDPPWLDKQVFRDEAAKQWKEKEKKPLEFSDSSIKKGVVAYHKGFQMITGYDLESFEDKYLQ